MLVSMAQSAVFGAAFSILARLLLDLGALGLVAVGLGVVGLVVADFGAAVFGAALLGAARRRGLVVQLGAGVSGKSRGLACLGAAAPCPWSCWSRSC